MASVLEAAVQVLAQEGAARFTTARVAARAGVSVGSLYQYFPNKAAILFRLQSDEWRQTTDLLGRILTNVDDPPLVRLRALIHAFLRSECEEAQVRQALADAAPLYRGAPEAKAARASSEQSFKLFFAEALPELSETRRALVADLVLTTMAQVSKRFSEDTHSAEAIDAYAEAMADMICGYMDGLVGGDKAPASG